MKQKQHHGPRAPHGRPEKTERVGIRLSPADRRKVMRKGGSAWVRELIRKAP
jgi:hypothetical protein